MRNLRWSLSIQIILIRNNVVYMNNTENYKYKYKVFGLNIASDFYLDGLLPGTENPDVEIIYGKVQNYIENTADIAGNFVFEIRNTAKCSVSKGKRVVIEPFEGICSAKIGMVILTSVMSVLILQRGLLPIHGSALMINGRCIIIAGEPGAGKSTLAFALREKGLSFVTDDISVLSFHDDGSIWVEAGYPMQKLCRDSAERNKFEVEAYTRVIGSDDKYFFPVSENYLEERVPLTSIFELAAGDCRSVALEKVSGARKLSVVIRQTYRKHFISLMGIESEHFAKCSRLAKSVDIYRLIRPENGYSTDEQIRLVLDVLDKQYSI